MSTFTERHAAWLREAENTMTNAKFMMHAYRGKDLLTEAMSRLSMARAELEFVAKAWEPGFCPSITCNEANALFSAMGNVGVDESTIDNFMRAHAYMDDEDDDGHIILVDGNGDVVGWSKRYPDDVEVDDPTPTSPEMFEAVGLVFYDPVTDSLATDHRQPTQHEGEPL